MVAKIARARELNGRAVEVVVPESEVYFVHSLVDVVSERSSNLFSSLLNSLITSRRPASAASLASRFWLWALAPHSPDVTLDASATDPRMTTKKAKMAT